MRPGGRLRSRPDAFRVTALALAGLVLAASCGSPSPTPPPTPSPAPTSGSAVAPPPVSSIVVSLSRRGGERTAHAGYPVELVASALGMTGIVALELWNGGDRIELTRPDDPARPAQTADWEWTPTAAGDYALVARAFDAAGHSAQSSAVRLAVVADPPRSWTLIDVLSAEGDTLASIVAAHGGDLSAAAYWNPGLPGGPLPAGTSVAVPIRDAVPPAASSAARAAVPGDVRALVTAPAVPAGLATPTLDLAVDGCTVTAQAGGGTGSTTGFAFSVLPPGSNSFVALPAVQAADGKAAAGFLALGGVNYVSVAAFDQVASAPSAIVPITLPPSCSAAGWAGDARLESGKLIVPLAADRAYLYLQAGTGAWQRVPAAPNTFVDAVGGSFDFAAVLPPVAGLPVKLEAWGWSGGKLVRLGAGTYTPPSEALYGQAGWLAPLGPVGLGTTLDIVTQTAGGEIPETLARDSAVDRPGPNSTSAVKTFKWSTTLAGVTALQWQILPYPLKDSTNPAPPFLIDTGTVDVTGLTSGYFTIDLKPYLLDGASTGVTSAIKWGQEQLLAKLVQTNPFAPAGPTAKPNVVLNPNGPWAPTTTGTVGGGGTDDLALLTPPLTSLYVRVIPYAGTAAAGGASDSVSFKIVEPGDPFYLDPTPPAPTTYPDAYTYEATFFAPTGSNPAFYNCVRVVKGGSKNEPLPYFGDWSNGTTHCRPKDDGGWSLVDAFEAFVSWVATAWDWISGAYDWIQDQVVNAVLLFVPCEQIAKNVTDNAKEACQKLAKTALHAVMIAYGIPPEIPNWEQTVAAAKGDLRDYILENAKQQFPAVEYACDAADGAHQAKSDFPTCDQVVDKAIDETVNRVMDQRSSAASNSTGVAVPPGVVVEPDPRSTPQPPHFTVKMTRTNAALPANVVCTMTASMTSTVANWSWKEYQWSDGNASIVQKTGPVSGQPFLPVEVKIAGLQPGQSATYALWLAQPSTWFEPDGWFDHYAQQYAEANGESNHAWVLLMQGATVKGTLSGNCMAPGSVEQVLTGQASQ